MPPKSAKIQLSITKRPRQRLRVTGQDVKLAIARPRRMRAHVAKPSKNAQNAASYRGVGSTIGLKRSQLSPPLSYNMRVPYTEECIGAITTPGATFTNSTFVINPANVTTFPWLSTIAAKFEKYKFNKLMFKLVSSSADAVGSTNTALGTVILNTNYDVLDTAFATQTQMEDYGGAAEDKPAEHQTHSVDCKGRRGGTDGYRFNLPSSGTTASAVAYPSNSSAHDYDLGLFQIATVGQQAASTIGRLYVCYQVDLMRRKVDTPLGQSLFSAHIVESPAVSAAAAGSAFLGTSGGSLRTGSLIPTVTTGNTFTLPLVGRFLIAWGFTGSVTVVPTFTGGSATANVTIVADNAASGFSTTDGSTKASGFFLFDVSTPGTGAANTVTITGLTSLAAGKADIFITQVSSGLTALRQDHDNKSRLADLERIVARLAIVQTDDYVRVPRLQSTTSFDTRCL